MMALKCNALNCAILKCATLGEIYDKLTELKYVVLTVYANKPYMCISSLDQWDTDDRIGFVKEFHLNYIGADEHGIERSCIEVRCDTQLLMWKYDGDNVTICGFQCDPIGRNEFINIARLFYPQAKQMFAPVDDVPVTVADVKVDKIADDTNVNVNVDNIEDTIKEIRKEADVIVKNIEEDVENANEKINNAIKNTDKNTDKNENATNISKKYYTSTGPGIKCYMMEVYCNDKYSYHEINIVVENEQFHITEFLSYAHRKNISGDTFCILQLNSNKIPNWNNGNITRSVWQCSPLRAAAFAEKYNINL